MNHFASNITVLSALLLFEAWNIATARRRGGIFVGLWHYSKARNPRDFKVGYYLNIVWFFVIVITMLIYVREHL